MLMGFVSNEAKFLLLKDLLLHLQLKDVPVLVKYVDIYSYGGVKGILFQASSPRNLSKIWSSTYLRHFGGSI